MSDLDELRERLAGVLAGRGVNGYPSAEGWRTCVTIQPDDALVLADAVLALLEPERVWCLTHGGTVPPSGSHLFTEGCVTTPLFRIKEQP